MVCMEVTAMSNPGVLSVPEVHMPTCLYIKKAELPALPDWNKEHDCFRLTLCSFRTVNGAPCNACTLLLTKQNSHQVSRPSKRHPDRVPSQMKEQYQALKSTGGAGWDTTAVSWTAQFKQICFFIQNINGYIDKARVTK